MHFFICGQLMRHLPIKLFHLSSLLQRPNNHRLVNAEIFSDFSCGCKSVSFDDPVNWSLSTSDSQPNTPHLQGSHVILTTCALMCLLAISGPNTLLMSLVVSAVLDHILNKKIA